MKRCIGITKISHHTYKAKVLFLALLLLSLFLIILPNAASAAIHYVRAGATGSGNGSDWTNAWTDLPSSFVRGDTYYIADGTYGVHDFATAESGSNYIYIYKATASDHGTGTGWNSSYGDGQAHFNADQSQSSGAILTFQTGYWIFDGQSGSGSDESSYGFKVSPVTRSIAATLIGCPAASQASLQLDHIQISHTSLVSAGSSYDVAQRGINSSGTGNAHNNITISNNYIGNACNNIVMRHWDNGTIENNYFAGNWGSSANHGGCIVPGGTTALNSGCFNVVLRNNVFKECATYVVDFHKGNDTGAIGNSGWQIYNNIVLGVNPTHDLQGIWATGSSNYNNVMVNLYIHHNTHINVPMTNAICVGNITVADGATHAYNNLFYNCNNPRMTNSSYTANAIVHTNNAFFDCTGTYDGDEGGTAFVGTGDPFVDSAHGDFHLIPSITIDAGASDIETYPPPPTPPAETTPSQPTGLSIISG